MYSVIVFEVIGSRPGCVMDIFVVCRAGQLRLLQKQEMPQKRRSVEN